MLVRRPMSGGAKFNSAKFLLHTQTHTRTHWVLFLLMGSKGTSFSWCGVIEAAVLKGCVPLLLWRHKVMQTPSQLLTQEVSMVRCPLMREADSYLIFVFSLDVALLTPCRAKQCSVVHLSPRERRQNSLRFFLQSLWVSHISFPFNHTLFRLLGK